MTTSVEAPDGAPQMVDSGDAAVVLDRVDKSFRGPTGLKTVVHDLSFSVLTGEFFSLLGPSGCGKTTTLRMIAGLEMVDSGRIFLAGKDATDLPAHARNVNTVFQNYALFPHLRVFDNVAYGLRRQHVPKSELQRRVMEALSLVRMDGFAMHRPQQLSGGQQQRIALARSIVTRPTVLLLDEPLAALDLKLRESMQEELKRLQRELQLSFIFVTHDQAEAFAMSDRVAVMEGGNLVQVGTPEELYLRPATRFVTTFVGRANFIPATLVDGTAMERPDAVASRQLSESPDSGAPGATEPTIFVRPERLIVRVGAAGADVQGPRVHGVVVDKTFSGGLTMIRVMAGDVEITATCDSASREAREATVGEAVVLTWLPEDATLLDR
ncbi:MAG TPA: ABC transporter ATP-binding protein [Acidimicrobiales bacterium]|nr:ABC transporter ATP-binding protein [Acidimicrobiales bacterium]